MPLPFTSFLSDFIDWVPSPAMVVLFELRTIE